MKQDLLEIMPEFLLIEDPGLREKTIEVWLEAMASESWNVDDLVQMPFTLLLKNVSVNIIDHTRAVTLIALRMAEVLKQIYGENIFLDRDILISGALLHDVGKLFEFKKEEGKFVKSEKGKLLRHPISGAAFAYKLGLPPEVVHIIAVHSKEGNEARRTVEAVILHHADFTNFDVFKD